MILAGLLAVSNLGADVQEQLLEQCAQQLVVEQSLAGRFRQEKHVEFLSDPIVSSGMFSLHQTDGIAWHVTDPLESLMEVHGTTVMLDGKLVRDHGVGRLMSLLMAGFMQGDLDSITRYFDVTGDVSENGWELTLKPRSRRMKSNFARMEIDGGQHLQAINIIERSGNRTLIEFSDVHASTGDESARETD